MLGFFSDLEERTIWGKSAFYIPQHSRKIKFPTSPAFFATEETSIGRMQRYVCHPFDSIEIFHCWQWCQRE